MRAFSLLLRRYAAVCAAAAIVGLPLTATAQDEMYFSSTWNGYRVYLSPARHTDTGARGECNIDENTMGYWVAYDAAQGDYYNDVSNTTSDGRNLTARGYDVKIGTGTIQSAINNSNAWGADLHIVIHSNADMTTGVDCSRTNASAFGTVGIYRSGSVGGQTLTDAIRNAVGPASPGTNDIICFNPGDPCTTKDLGELRETTAVASYLESEFHTWNIGADWLWAQLWWRWRIGVGVDQYLGYS